jgi:hypothetical protein
MVLKASGDEKDFVGIGKFMIDTTALSWNIPQLHFLVDINTGHYEATCLEFGLVASGASQEKSVERLMEHTLHHIQTVMYDGGGYAEFKEVALNNFMNGYWDAYRHIEFCLAEKKKDLSHEIESRIMDAVQRMFDDKVRELISRKAREAADDAVREYERMRVFRITAVKYAPITEAA